MFNINLFPMLVISGVAQKGKVLSYKCGGHAFEPCHGHIRHALSAN